MILLDTNICIYIINAKPAAVLQRFRQYRIGEIGVCSVVAAELAYGVAKSGPVPWSGVTQGDATCAASEGSDQSGSSYAKSASWLTVKSCLCQSPQFRLRWSRQTH
jgi:predicted nucleic acid-binding protein